MGKGQDNYAPIFVWKRGNRGQTGVGINTVLSGSLFLAKKINRAGAVCRRATGINCAPRKPKN